MNIKTTLKKAFFPLLKKISDLYLSKERSYRHKDITVKVQPGVFHPGFFISTKLLLNYLEKLDLRGSSFLELGAGSGFLSVYAAGKDAVVTSTDISLTAVKNCTTNAEINNVKINTINSDLFDKIPKSEFGYIVINPPYFPQSPKTEKDYAWYCGNNFEYFEKLFKQIKDYINESSVVIMILADNCDIQRIKEIAGENSFRLNEVFRKKVLWEENYIFRICQ